MKKKPNHIRIIGGQWKRSVVEIPIATDLRPTPSRVRETLFNWLAPDIAGMACLDLFAGSGILGLEALSRGAESCTWVEREPVISQALKQNLARLTKTTSHTMETSIVQQNALSWLSQPGLPTYDLIFIDPPFQTDLLRQSIASIQQHHPALYKRSLFYLESAKKLDAQLPADLQAVKTAHYGQVYFGLYAA